MKDNGLALREAGPDVCRVFLCRTLLKPVKWTLVHLPHSSRFERACMMMKLCMGLDLFGHSGAQAAPAGASGPWACELSLRGDPGMNPRAQRRHPWQTFRAFKPSEDFKHKMQDRRCSVSAAFGNDDAVLASSCNNPSEELHTINNMVRNHPVC